MSDLEKLKDLLFGAEKEVLDSISERVESRELRSADVADILPEAIHASHRQGTDLRESLREPIGQCLQQEFRDDPQTYGDALYPVMGPAIRKSIMHALRTFTQQINAALEQSLTPKGLSWRLQAWRAGVPFGDYVMQKTLLYRVEQAYLISRENGLLVGHAQHEAARIKDSDAVSAMFTAIQDFVKESFSPDRTGRLESADMGEFTLWAVHGPHALLVCVIRGVPPRSLRADLSAILERIHFRYGDAIRTYSGDTASVPEVEAELAACLRLEAKQENGTLKKRVPWPLLVILLLAAAAVAYFGITRWSQAREVDRLRAALDETPGLYVSLVERDDGRIRVSGLRDPLAPTVSAVAADVGLAGAEIVADMQAFHSLDPDLLARRAAARFGTPDGVQFVVEDSRLVVLGRAPLDWQDDVLAAYPGLAGIESVEFRMSPTERALPEKAAEFEERMSPMERALPEEAAEREAQMSPTEPRRLDALIEELNGRAFYFLAGTTLTEASATALPDYLNQLLTAEAVAASLDMGVGVTITGFADAVGGPEINSVVADQRAETIAGALRGRGWNGDIATRSGTPSDETTTSVDLERRRVTIELHTTASPAPR